MVHGVNRHPNKSFWKEPSLSFQGQVGVSNAKRENMSQSEGPGPRDVLNHGCLHCLVQQESATFKMSHELNGTRYECLYFKQRGIRA